jgi:glycerol-3-phosphate dehydrogenase (NAD(P)+)
MKRATVLGAGAWGTALALALERKGHDVALWAHDPAHADALARDRENVRLLPGFALPERIRATSSLPDALADTELVVLVVPSHVLRGVALALRPHLPSSALLCSATKGIENGTLMLMSQVLEDILGAEARARLTYLSGPSFAKEVAHGMPTAVVVAGSHEEAARAVQRAFASDRLRVYSSHDVVGVEVGGALKNVIAIAAGVIDGLGLGHNARAGMITRGLYELGLLAARLGGDPLTVAGLSGMGDLVLTCTGELSRNRSVGVALGQGRTLPEILASLGHVAEGVKTARSAYELGLREGVEMPITQEVYRVLYDAKDPRRGVADIMARELRSER